jgi:small subunit ribosomal protein S3Ae
VKQLAVKKAKAKQWFLITAPKYFGEIEIGKTTASEPQSLINRRIAVSAMDLTNNLGKYYLKFIFKINNVIEDKALTEFDGSECLRDYISRMIVRRVRRVDTVQNLITKDGKKIRVKGIAIIRRRIKSSIQKTIRSRIEELLKTEIQNLTLEEFVKKILSDEIKNKILHEVKKIYPVRNFEIRKTEVLS